MNTYCHKHLGFRNLTCRLCWNIFEFEILLLLSLLQCTPISCSSYIHIYMQARIQTIEELYALGNRGLLQHLRSKMIQRRIKWTTIKWTGKLKRRQTFVFLLLPSISRNYDGFEQFHLRWFNLVTLPLKCLL